MAYMETNPKWPFMCSVTLEELIMLQDDVPFAARLPGQRMMGDFHVSSPRRSSHLSRTQEFPPRRSDFGDVGCETFDTKAPRNAISNGGDVGVKMQLSRKNYENSVKQSFRIRCRRLSLRGVCEAAATATRPGV